MRRRRVAAAAMAALATTSCTNDARPRDDLPRVMAALGDSMTRAYLLCDGRPADCPEASWSTGTEVDSHLVRLRALGADVEGHNHAVSGATVDALPAQAERAIRSGADYVTILIGANDVCRPSWGATTGLPEFRRSFRLGLETLTDGLPDAKVLVVSIPDLRRLWTVGKDDPAVRETWERHGICQSMLARPLSNDADDVARRERVGRLAEAFNNEMKDACARYVQCRWDVGAVYHHAFGLDAVSDVDRWHPSRAGQEALAAVTWGAGYYARQST